MKFNPKDFSTELTFKSSKSSGKGGQHVNKTESRISLFFNVLQSEVLSEQEKQKLLLHFKQRISKEGVLQIDVEKSRSQHQNKKLAIAQLMEILEEGLKEKKKRKLSKPSKAAIRKRLKEKKIRSEKKENRKKYRF